VSAPVGFRAPEVTLLTGLTYRQIDHYARQDIIAPSVEAAHGSGSARLWSESDVVALRVAERLRRVGVPLDRVKVATAYVSQHGREDDCPYLYISASSVGYTGGEETVRGIDFDGGPVIILNLEPLWLTQA
jgi:DNA-binding transcriptional MerR regulator